MKNVFVLVGTVILVQYMLARIFILVEAFASLRNLPVGSYKTDREVATFLRGLDWVLYRCLMDNTRTPSYFLGISTGGKFNSFHKFNDVSLIGFVSFFLCMTHMNLVEVGRGCRRLRGGKSGRPGRT